MPTTRPRSKKKVVRPSFIVVIVDFLVAYILNAMGLPTWAAIMALGLLLLMYWQWGWLKAHKGRMAVSWTLFAAFPIAAIAIANREADTARAEALWRRIDFSLNSERGSQFNLGACPQCLHFALGQIKSYESGVILQELVFGGEGLGLVDTGNGGTRTEHVLMVDAKNSELRFGARPYPGAMTYEMELRSSIVLKICSAIYDARVAITSTDVENLQLTLWIRPGGDGFQERCREEGTSL